jgi:DEAD/DEAH box helicase domain-containing protein
LEHALRIIAPSKLICEPRNIMGLTYAPLEAPKTVRLLLYDNIQGGIGLAEKAYAIAEDMISKALKLIRDCECKDKNGCPFCLQIKACDSRKHELKRDLSLSLAESLV